MKQESKVVILSRINELLKWRLEIYKRLLELEGNLKKLEEQEGN